MLFRRGRHQWNGRTIPEDRGATAYFKVFIVHSMPICVCTRANIFSERICPSHMDIHLLEYNKQDLISKRRLQNVFPLKQPVNFRLYGVNQRAATRRNKVHIKC